MKRLLFGNKNTSYWKLSVDEVSRHEQIVVISGELHAEFFVASTPMSVDPQELGKFATELDALDRTLQGTARLVSANNQSEVDWSLTALPLGHIASTGRFKINGNELLFNFRADQTQLRPLANWVKSVLFIYANRDDAEPMS